MRLTDGIGRRLVLGNQYAMQLFDKLKILEDIEEELSIDLIILFKALKDGVWIKEGRSLRTEICFNVENEYVIGCWLTKYECVYYRLKDYGKTWALTKEELL